jgi:hypothetical protein
LGVLKIILIGCLFVGKFARAKDPEESVDTAEAAGEGVFDSGYKGH